MAIAARIQPPSNEIALVANAQAGTVALVDVASRSVLGAIDVNPARVKGEGPGAPNYAQDTDVSPDGRTLYVSRGYLGDVGTLQVRDRIQLDNAIRPWQFTPDEKGLYAQLSNEHAVVAYNLAARKVVSRLDLPMKPGVTVADWDFEAPHHGLALTPDGKTLCLAGRASDYAALVRAPDLKLIATIPVGDAPGWAETADNGRVCIIANIRSDNLSMISIPGRTEIVRLPIGDGPKHITVARIPASVVAAFKARQRSNQAV